MADSIVIRFATQSLDKARETAKQIAKQVQATARQLKDLPRETRQAFREAAKNAAKQRQEEIKAQADRLNLLQRAQAVSGRNLPSGFAGANAVLNRGKGAFDQVSGLAGNLASGNVAGLLGGAAGVAGPVAAVAATVAAIVLPILRRELNVELAAMETRSAARQERDRFQADVRRRFREDVDFRDEQVRRALDEDRRRERALREGGWRRGGRFTVSE